MPTPKQSAKPVEGETTLTELPRAAQKPKAGVLPENSPFALWVDPASVQFVAGEALYRPVAIPISPGVQGVGTDGYPDASDAWQRRHGRIMVPMDVEVVAWGAKRRGYLVQRDNGQDLNGKQLWHYHDAWTSYEQVGSRTSTERDQDGYIEFCRGLTAVVGHAPRAQVVRMERARLEAASRVYRSSQSLATQAEGQRIQATLAAPSPA